MPWLELLGDSFTSDAASALPDGGADAVLELGTSTTARIRSKDSVTIRGTCFLQAVAALPVGFILTT